MTIRILLLAILVLGARPAAAYEQRFNCGAGQHVGEGGAVFDTDQPYTPGGAGYVGGFASNASWEPIGGTPDPEIYEVSRASLTAYRFDVPDGHYLVTLHLVDIYTHSTGENVFDVVMEEATVFAGVDVYERVRRTHAIDFTATVEVTDGVLDVDFVPVAGFPTIGAISVVSRTPDALAPSTPSGLAAGDGYGAVLLGWDAVGDDDVAGYQVERGDSIAGPFSPVSAPNGDFDRVTWRIDPVAPGLERFYRVRAIDAYGNVSPPSPVVVSGVSLAATATDLARVEVLIDPAHLETLNDQPTTDVEQPVTVVFDGSQAFAPATGRYRGNVARSLLKKSWKLKLDPLAGNYANRDNFNVNAEYIDKGLMRESIAYLLLGRAGAPTPETRHVHLSVNGEWQGLYLDIENINTEFLERVGLRDTQATMYKVEAELEILPTVQDYMNSYEKELGDPADYTDLIAFIEGLNQTPQDEMFQWLAAHVDLNRLFDFYSSQVFLQNVDIAYKNFFLHHDLVSDVWTVIPWDVDLTFGTIWPFGENGTHTQSIYLGTINQLFVQVFLDPTMKQLHFDRLRQLAETTFEPVVVDAAIDSVHALIDDDGLRDWWKWGWNDDTAFLAAPAEMKQFVRDRAAFLEGQILAQEAPADLCINEVVASNGSVYADEFGEYDDFVELYNRGAAPLSTAGLYLTDDLALPGRFALPDTTLDPGEYLLVWCDGDSLQGPWHAPFKLDVAGEAVGLFTGPTASDAAVDVRPFDAQWTNASLGRLPDGSAYWQILPTVTPLAANVGGGNLQPQFRDHDQFPHTPQDGEPVSVATRIFDDGVVVSAELIYDAGGGVVSVPLRDDGASGDGAAGDDIYGATIPGHPASTQVSYYMTALDELAASGFDPSSAPDSTYDYSVGYTPPALYLNEFMAANDTTLADELGDFDDWVEIVNLSGGPIDLSGRYLTDDLFNPDRFAFPDTVLQNGQFLLVWCDGEPLEGPLHAPFKLSAAGEELGLFDTAATGFGAIDTHVFGPQTPDVSSGRLPDGTGAWQVLPQPTPGWTNDPVIGVGDLGAVPRVMRLRAPVPNPFRPSTRLRLELPLAERVRVAVFDVTGRRVRSIFEGRLPAGVHALDWDGTTDAGARAASGVYWVRLQSSDAAQTVRAVLLR